ncbi:MAG: hypothetical protein CVU57_19130 [Deltaproteobacteria bacterium HGW-Deltaproteobacteria-15]|jgi:hypothetical protein|nr:MAG: hypothetical protein CVU57_19130 [Deltaproteobacteria bacterium HGW-Deltaproteobacteria-15]
MQVKIGGICPLIKKGCIQTRCEWFVHIRGKDPQSEREIDEYGCAIAWLPILLIENAQMERQTGAAVESFRNEMVNQNAGLEALIEAAAKRRLIEG